MFRSKKFQKILIWTLILIFELNFLLIGATAKVKAAKSGQYPPETVNISASTCDLNSNGTSIPKLIVYWTAPANIQDFRKDEGGYDQDKLWWRVIVYEIDSSGNQIGSPIYDSYNSDYTEMRKEIIGTTRCADTQWGKSYRAYVSLHYNGPQGDQLLGRNDQTIKLEAPKSNTATCSGTCHVEDLTAQVENLADGTHKLHLGWKWNSGPGCGRNVKIYYGPDNKAVTFDLNRTLFPDDNMIVINDAQPGRYKIVTVNDTGDQMGFCTINASFSTQDTGASSGKTDEKGKGGGENGPGESGTGDEASYCDQFTASWGRGLMKTILNPLGATVCALIRAFEEMAHWILDQAADVINA